MRICFISEYFWPEIRGGGEINAYLFCRALAKKGHEVHVITSEGEEVEGLMMHGVLRKSNTKTILGNLNRIFASDKKEVLRIIEENEFDVIHLIGASLQYCNAIRRVTKTPVFYTCESYIALCPKGDFMVGDKADISRWGIIKTISAVLKSDEIGMMRNVPCIRYNPLAWLVIFLRQRRLERNMLNSEVLAVSKYVKNILRQNYGIVATVMPNFVPSEFFVKKQSQEPKHLLYLGTFSKFKGGDTVLKAIKNLNVTLKVYGKRVGEFSQSNVEWHDPVPYFELPKIISNATIVLAPSEWPEPFSRVTIEAQAIEVPVIASSSGNLPYLTKHTFRKGEPEDLREKILSTLHHHPRVSLAKEYTEEVVVNKLLDVYREAMCESQ